MSTVHEVTPSARQGFTDRDIDWPDATNDTTSEWAWNDSSPTDAWKRNRWKRVITYRDGTKVTEYRDADPRGDDYAQFESVDEQVSVKVLEVPSLGFERIVSQAMTPTFDTNDELVAWERKVTVEHDGDPTSSGADDQTWTYLWERWASTPPSPFPSSSVFGRTDTSPEGRITRLAYDADGDLIWQDTPQAEPTSYTYLSDGKLDTITEGGTGGSTTDYAYLTNDRTDYIDHPDGTQTDFTSYDSIGRTLGVTEPGSRSIQYTWDGQGNMISLTPPGRPSHDFTYSVWDTTKTYDPATLAGGSQGTWTHTYGYDLDGQQDQVIWPTSDTITRTYDSAGQLTDEDGTDTALDYTYDASTGQRLTADASYKSTLESELDYTYDNRKLQKVQQTLHSGINTYTTTVTNVWRDQTLWLQSREVAGVRVGRHHDDDGLVTALTEDNGNTDLSDDHILLDVSRGSSNGLITQETFEAPGASDKLVSNYTYNDFGQVDSATHKVDSTGTVLFKYDVKARDAAQRITELQETVNGTETEFRFSYDNAGRLAEVKTGPFGGPFTVEEELDYTNNGSFTCVDQPSDNQQYTFSSDEQDRITGYESSDPTDGVCTSDGQTDIDFSWDLNGFLDSFTYVKVGGVTYNLTFDYEYDLFGNLRKVQASGGQPFTYGADARGRRTAKWLDGNLERIWVYDGIRPVAEFYGNGNLRNRMVFVESDYRPKILKHRKTDGTTEWLRYITDWRGSVRMVVTSDGTIRQQGDYSATGSVSWSTGNDFQPLGFASGLEDKDLPIVRFGARDYFPGIMSWTARDPIGFESNSTNLYSYGNSDSINYVDPTGLSAQPTTPKTSICRNCDEYDNLDEEAIDFIARCVKGKVHGEFPSEFYHWTLGEIDKCNTARCKKAWKLLTDKRWRK